MTIFREGILLISFSVFFFFELAWLVFCYKKRRRVRGSVRFNSIQILHNSRVTALGINGIAINWLRLQRFHPERLWDSIFVGKIAGMIIPLLCKSPFPKNLWNPVNPNQTVLPIPSFSYKLQIETRWSSWTRRKKEPGFIRFVKQRRNFCTTVQVAMNIQHDLVDDIAKKKWQNRRKKPILPIFFCYSDAFPIPHGSSARLSGRKGGGGGGEAVLSKSTQGKIETNQQTVRPYPFLKTNKQTNKTNKIGKKR